MDDKKKKKTTQEKLDDVNVDLNSFKKNDVVKRSEKKGKAKRTSSAGSLSFGGSLLGGKVTRMQRKKGNRSSR
tara:strand:- start:4121 stop:4339 length:219 start_codon:yes stop_codon:yes gene_type:complete